MMSNIDVPPFRSVSILPDISIIIAQSRPFFYHNIFLAYNSQRCRFRPFIEESQVHGKEDGMLL